MQPVMLATDGSPTARKATETAIELAQGLDTDLVVVTAWDIPYSTLGFAAVPVNNELITIGRGQAHKVADEAVAQAQEAGVEVRTMVLRGFPVDEICLAAEKVKPQLVVLGSHGWGAMKRMLFGSVSTGVLHRAKFPVMIVPGGAEDEMPAAELAREEVKA